ncbi:hypothetical protein DXM29_23835 [Agrobacterium tumefaciens]|nr:hypothetical protein DXM29_23835 [Agrobacterium tumefaciens]
MFNGDLTIEDVLSDPLIRQLMHADRVSSPQLRQLLHDARERYRAAGQYDRPTPAPAGSFLAPAETTSWHSSGLSAASQQNII